LDADTLALSRMCEENARAAAARTRRVLRAGPFEALLDEYDPMIWINYAVPVRPFRSRSMVQKAIEDLRQIFAGSKRRLRFEYHAGPWPMLTEVLQEAGLTLQAAHPVMVCTAAELRPVVREQLVNRIFTGDTANTDLIAFRDIQAEGFGATPATLDGPELDRMREKLARGDELLGLSFVDGQPAAVAGLYPIDGVAELAGVAARTQLRRRGAASSISAALTADYFTRGGKLVWLSAGDAAAQAVYRSVGFRDIDTRLNYIDPQ
jgi:ribosomal protein S18 acetylase RimI-like enzyme